MKKIYFLCCIISSCLFSCNDSATTQSAPPVVISTKDTSSYTTAVTQNTTRGQEIFQERCQACHGVAGDNITNDAANLQTNRIDSISIVNTIKNGKGRMPMFSGTLHDSDYAQLALYVKTLRKP